MPQVAGLCGGTAKRPDIPVRVQDIKKVRGAGGSSPCRVWAEPTNLTPQRFHASTASTAGARCATLIDKYGFFDSLHPDIPARVFGMLLTGNLRGSPAEKIHVTDAGDYRPAPPFGFRRRNREYPTVSAVPPPFPRFPGRAAGAAPGYPTGRNAPETCRWSHTGWDGPAPPCGPPPE